MTAIPEGSMRDLRVALCLVFFAAASSFAQVSIGIGIGLPGVNIGINFPAYPQLVPVPGYPVYYAPQASSNYFFYDGMYWVYQRDNWYASSWYNGPWWLVEPEAVPVYVLRVPVRYYRRPPTYFRGWQPEAPPRWGEHWGPSWDERHRGWDRWDRNAAPARAPLPIYQKKYPTDRYPQAQQQQGLHSQNYHYRPSDPVVREHFQQPAPQRSAPPPPRAQQSQGQKDAPQDRAASPAQQRQPPQSQGQKDAPQDRGAPPARQSQPQQSQGQKDAPQEDRKSVV
jgi:hypothetical protein